MSLPTVVSLSHDHGSLSNTRTLTLSKGGSLVIKEIPRLPDDPSTGKLYEIFVSDERDLHIRDCLTHSVADYLNRIGTVADRRDVTGSPARIGRHGGLRTHIMLSVLFLQDPQLEEHLTVLYTPVPCREPQSIQLRRLTGLGCLGYVKTIV